MIKKQTLRKGVVIKCEGELLSKEEIIAFVLSTKPFSLSLDFSSQLNNDENFLVDQINQYASNCNCFVSASAIGIYGPDISSGLPFTENAKAYSDFLGLRRLLPCCPGG